MAGFWAAAIATIMFGANGAAGSTLAQGWAWQEQRAAMPGLGRASAIPAGDLAVATKMSGYDSGYLPPPTFGPHNRSGPMVVGVSACCNNGQWYSPQAGWRASF
jgi:hypothetical protein